MIGITGGIGTFVTVSTTVSNLLLGEFQRGTAGQLGLSCELCLAAQTAGGATGNMISVQNTIAVCAVVGLSGKEGLVLRRAFRAFLVYSLGIALMTCLLMVAVRAF